MISYAKEWIRFKLKQFLEVDDIENKVDLLNGAVAAKVEDTQLHRLEGEVSVLSERIEDEHNKANLIEARIREQLGVKK